jgi:hypothetical protein
MQTNKFGADHIIPPMSPLPDPESSHTTPPRMSRGSTSTPPIDGILDFCPGAESRVERVGHNSASKEEPGTQGRRRRWAGRASLGFSLSQNNPLAPLAPRSGGGTTFSRSRRGREMENTATYLGTEGAPRHRRCPPPRHLPRGRGRPPESRRKAPSPS